MKRALTSATAYFLVMFGLGFVLGTVRVLVVAPRLGAFAATALELPIMLTAAFIACRWAVRRWQVPGAIGVRVAMMLWFLALLLLFETLLGVTLFGRSLGAQWAAFITPDALLGLTAQVLAAALPLLLGRHQPR